MHQSWLQLLVESTYALVQYQWSANSSFQIKGRIGMLPWKTTLNLRKNNPFKYFDFSNVTICDKKPALSKFMLIQKKKKTNATTREYPINEVNSSVYAIRYFPDWPYQFCITQFSDRDKSPYCQIPHARRLNFLSILKYVYYSEPNLERPIHCRLFKEWGRLFEHDIDGLH